MPLTLPAAPSAPTLTNPATFETDCSAFLAWMAAIATAMTGKALIVSDILGPVSQSGGVPTGALIEQGSNANGTYTKFADGTMLCRHGLTSSASGETTWTFPAAFAGLSASISVLVLPVSASATLLAPRRAGRTTETVLFSVFNASARVETPVDLMAIGRWF